VDSLDTTLSMFREADSFNQDINASGAYWTMSGVTSIFEMFA
jgi:hypothetical protein